MANKQDVPVLEVDGLSVSFRMYDDTDNMLAQKNLQVISDLSMHVHAGEVLAVAGSSGSGKSLLASAILGILPENAAVGGAMRYQGQEMTPDSQRRLRGTEIALVPQSVSFLDPLMRVGAQVHGDGRAHIFRRLGLPEETVSCYPFQLSGGMARRVLVSTALITDAQLIIADEPTPGMSLDQALEALRFFRETADDGKAVILITHDIDLAFSFADRIAVFYAGMIVETARGIEYGTVVADPREVEEDKVVQPLKAVLRIANQKDDEQEAANKKKEKDAFQICLEKIRKHGLQMKLIDAEYTFDNNKVLFYFTADGRIDFRELVKDLASVFKTRIELRQIGVRDETKILGGIGICGRPLCCHTHLSEFAPVSIKMAKEQNLSLNPTKISGVCGRLMCCLKNEEETYEELNRKLPNVGDFVTTEDGLKGEVQSVNVLRQLVKVIVDVDDEKEIQEYRADQLRFKKRHGKNRKTDANDAELRELEKLEKQDGNKAGIDEK